MANPIRQLLSQTSYVADGSQTVWNFSFSGGYIDKSHVKAKYLDANRVEHQIAVTSGMFIGPYQLNITPPVAAGSELVIYRDTPKGEPLVDFIDAASLTEASLDLSAKQGVFVAAESSDLLVTTIASTDQLQAKLVQAEVARAGAAVAEAGAASQASASAASAAESLGYLQAYRSTSYGALSADPVTDPLGNPPTVGDEYFNTSANLLKRWNGATWQASDINTANLAASGGSALVGHLPSGVGSLPTTVTAKLQEIISLKENGAAGNGVANDGASVRGIFAKAAAGSTVLLKKGTYLLDKDGANSYCLLIDKVLHLIIEPGVIFKAATDNLRAVVRVTAPITHSGVLCVDADYRANFGIEATAGAKGLTLTGWEAKKVTQQFNPALACAPFVIYNEVGISLIECKANNALAYANGTIGDTPGASRGVYIFGVAPEFGINRVLRCQIDSIVNTNGVAGNYEDEDGVESSMTGGYTIVRESVFTNCMKRGVKMMSAGEVIDNIILTSRNHATDYDKGMWTGISIYSNNVKAYGNKVMSLNVLYGATPGRVYYGIEVGATGGWLDSVDCFENQIELGAGALSKYFEGIHVNGALTRGKIRDNKIKTHADTVLEGTYGIRMELDHATQQSNISVNANDFTHFTNGISIRGGFSGDVSKNTVQNAEGIGIVVYDSAFALKPKNINFTGNLGKGFDNYLVRVADPLTVGISAAGNMSDAASFPTFSVAGTLKYTETGSVGIGRSATMYGSAAPTAGTYVRGERVVNSAPMDASPVIEWQCQYGGTPGTWRSSQWMTLKNTTAKRPVLTISDVGVQYLDTTLAANGKLITWAGFAWVDSLGAAV